MTDKFSTCLENTPRENYSKFLVEVLAAASKTCSAHLDTGLVFALLSNNEWANFPNNKVIAADGTITIKPKPSVERPVPPEEDASSNAWKMYEAESKRFVAITECTEILQKKLLNSLPEADQTELHHPSYGLLMVTSLDIMQHLHTKYGSLQGPDFDALDLQLEKKLEAVSDFAAHAAHMQIQFNTFANHQQPKSQLDKMRLLKKAVQHHGQIQRAIDQYYIETPLVFQQSFENMVARVKVLAPNFSDTSGSMGYAGASQSTDIIAALVAAEVKAALANMANVNNTRNYRENSNHNTGRGRGNTRGRGDNGRGRGDRNNDNDYHPSGRGNFGGRSRNNDNSPTHYCFRHGYGYHASLECTYMNQHYKDYTTANFNATDHTTGGSSYHK